MIDMINELKVQEKELHKVST